MTVNGDECKRLRETLHTDRIRVMYENIITPHLNLNVRRAYSVHDNDETRDKTNLMPVNPFPFYSEDTDDNSMESSIEEEEEEEIKQCGMWWEWEKWCGRGMAIV